MVTFANFPLLWLSKLQIEIDLSTLHSEYVAFSHSVRALLPLKSLIKEVIYNLRIDCENLKFVKDDSYIKANCSQVSLVQAARWKGICDLEDRVRKSESRDSHQRFTKSNIWKY